MARTRWLEIRTDAARRQAWAEHKAIIERLSARDCDGAAQLVVEHIQGTHSRLTAALDADRRHLRARGLSVVAG
jgi:DNA-binding GntR family transcriptional regulator